MKGQPIQQLQQKQKSSCCSTWRWHRIC
jgi:hypothetical protein